MALMHQSRNCPVCDTLNTAERTTCMRCFAALMGPSQRAVGTVRVLRRVRLFLAVLIGVGVVGFGMLLLVANAIDMSPAAGKIWASAILGTALTSAWKAGKTVV